MRHDSPDARAKQRAALASVAASAALALAKLAAGLASGSLALLSEGAHNALDIAASGLTYFAVREADKPADAEHPFGHAKIEAVAALAQTAFLASLAGVVAFEALRRLGGPAAAVDANGLAFAAILASIGVDFVRWRGLARIARQTRSDALAADALHFSSDLVSSFLVLAGLAATRFGVAHADALAAVGVALFIGVAGFRLGRRTIDALVDAAPKGLSADMRAEIARVGGVAGIDSIRLRRSGAQDVGDVGVVVSRTLPIERVAAIKADVLARIARRWPHAEVTVTANPSALDGESALERVQLVAGRRGLFVHHVTIQHLGGRTSVALHLEVDRRMSLGDAHEVATGLEGAIAEELGGAVEVETHIEPMAGEDLPSEAASPELTRAVAAALGALAARQGALRDVHDVRVRRAEDGVLVIFHARADAQTAVGAAHGAIDALERALKDQFPEVTRVIGHAEPAPAARAAG